MLRKYVPLPLGREFGEGGGWTRFIRERVDLREPLLERSLRQPTSLVVHRRSEYLRSPDALH
jgi:hypothetical protein